MKTSISPPECTPHVDAHHDRLAAEKSRALGDQLGSPDGCGIDGDFVRAAAEAFAHVLDAPDSAAPRERHETGPGNGFQNRQRIAEPAHLMIVTAQVVDVVPGDVEIDQFIDSPLVEAFDLVDRDCR